MLRNLHIIKLGLAVLGLVLVVTLCVTPARADIQRGTTDGFNVETEDIFSIVFAKNSVWNGENEIFDDHDRDTGVIYNGVGSGFTINQMGAYSYTMAYVSAGEAALTGRDGKQWDGFGAYVTGPGGGTEGIDAFLANAYIIVGNTQSIRGRLEFASILFDGLVSDLYGTTGNYFTGLWEYLEEGYTIAFDFENALAPYDEEIKKNSYTFTFARERSTVVPEPATLAVLGLGLAGLGLARRRRK